MVDKLISSKAGNNESIVCEVPDKKHIINIVAMAENRAGTTVSYDMRRSVMLLDGKHISFMLRDADPDRYAGIVIHELYILKGGL